MSDTDYSVVFIYDQTGRALGYGIKKPKVNQLHSINIWEAEEIPTLRMTIDMLNEQAVLSAHYPDADDPEVLELVEDPQWEPLALKEDRVIDMDKSVLLYARKPMVDDDGFPVFIGDEIMLSDEIDYDQPDTENSLIVHKTVVAPDPTEVQQRIYKAMNLVARKRAGLA